MGAVCVRRADDSDSANANSPSKQPDNKNTTQVDNEKLIEETHSHSEGGTEAKHGQVDEDENTADGEEPAKTSSGGDTATPAEKEEPVGESPKGEADVEPEEGAPMLSSSAKSEDHLDKKAVGDSDEDSDEEPGNEYKADPQAAQSRIYRMDTIHSSSDLIRTLLQEGRDFDKVGRRGKPKRKFVFLSDDMQLFWCRPGDREQDTKRMLDLSKVTDLREGKNTDVFKRKVANDFNEDNCLSIVTPDRTLDLVAQTEQIRDEWVAGLRYVSTKLKAASRQNSKENLATLQEE